ncbi:uncharacterized protein LOC135499441 [Lineus longissimus]|uniref:uncharacterized protein LOC135499441 n=1 Tax=Lineus longissimus TaxID=88925 RepID=UPI00315C5D6B
MVYHTHFKETWKYMIAANTTNTLMILKKADVVGMRDKDKAWFVVNPNINESDIEPHLLILDNIGLVKAVDSHEYIMCEPPEVAWHVLIRKMAEAYQSLIDLKGWTHQQITACQGSWALGDELMSIMKANIGPSVNRCDNLTQFELRANMWRGTRMGFVRSSIWNKRQGLVADGDVFPNARMGFNGKKFKVGMLAAMAVEYLRRFGPSAGLKVTQQPKRIYRAGQFSETSHAGCCES